MRKLSLVAVVLLFTGVSGQLHFTQTKTGSIVAGDVDGDAAADFQIFLAGVTALSAGDFVL